MRSKQKGEKQNNVLALLQKWLMNTHPWSLIINILEWLWGLWLLLLLFNFGAMCCHRFHKFFKVFTGVFQDYDASNGELHTQRGNQSKPYSYSTMLQWALAEWTLNTACAGENYTSTEQLLSEDGQLNQCTVGHTTLLYVHVAPHTKEEVCLSQRNDAKPPSVRLWVECSLSQHSTLLPSCPTQDSGFGLATLPLQSLFKCGKTNPNLETTLQPLKRFLFVLCVQVFCLYDCLGTMRVVAEAARRGGRCILCNRSHRQQWTARGVWGTEPEFSGRVTRTPWPLIWVYIIVFCCGFNGWAISPAPYYKFLRNSSLFYLCESRKSTNKIPSSNSRRSQKIVLVRENNKYNRHLSVFTVI